MRCKSFRVYTYVAFGILVGILLSSTIQLFALFSSAAVFDERPVVGTLTSLGDTPGDARRTREGLVQRDREGQGIDKEDSAASDSINPNGVPDYPIGGLLDLPDIENEIAIDQKLIHDEMQKKKVFMPEQNRQGRNMQDLHDNGSQGPVMKLSDEVPTSKPLLVAIITSIQQLMSQTIAIHGTWAKDEKDIVYFVGDVRTMPHLPHGMNVLQLEGIDDKVATWEMKEMAVFKYLVAHYSDSVDWYLIVGDDAFVKPDTIRRKLNGFNPNVNIYMGARRTKGGADERGGNDPQSCDPAPGVIYSKGLLSRLEQYLPLCLGEGTDLGSCIAQRGIQCTRAQETHELFFIDHNRIIETPKLYHSKGIIARAFTLYPIRYPKFMYRVHSFLEEIKYNYSLAEAANAASEIEVTHPFIPTHLQSPFKPLKSFQNPIVVAEGGANNPTTSSTPPDRNKNADINVRPRYIPKNKFEINSWDYFNQTRVMAINSEQPSHGIIGGIREEARYVLTKGIVIANKGLSSNDKLVFDKLENGWHRIDPMRGSEYMLDFIFRKNSDKSVRVRKRISLLRPFHDTVVPIDTPNNLPRVNFIITLSGLSDRLEQFLKAFERNVLIPREDASLTITLYNTPDADKVRKIIAKYTSLYPAALMFVKDVEGKFARGVGLHRGTKDFKDNELMFFVDIDLEIGPDFLHRARLSAIPGKQVYFPIFFKLYKPDFVHRYYKGNNTQLLSRHNGHWAHYSYGMVVIYTGDYRKVGGFDTSMKGWGEEDVDFFKKVLSHGFEVFRAPDPGLLHLWHPKLCNKETVKTQDAYVHCLQSKSENLADRVELAQYVFQNELKSGNSDGFL